MQIEAVNLNLKFKGEQGGVNFYKFLSYLDENEIDKEFNFDIVDYPKPHQLREEK